MMNILDLPLADHMRDESVLLFRESVLRFIERNIPPERARSWNDNGIVDREIWREAGEAGLVCVSLPEEFGGMGGDYRHEVVLMEELGRAGLDGWSLSLHNAIVAPYVFHYGTEAQKAAWLPPMATGEHIGAIAMTEPGTGSDLAAIRTTAVRDGDGWILNGSKIFITNGQLADIILVVAQTEPEKKALGLSIFAVHPDKVAGFRRGKNLDKIGFDANDTSELFFDDVRLPADALLGEEPGRGFAQLTRDLGQERLNIAVGGVAMMERALAVTVDYVKSRKAFGKTIFDFQNTQFKLAECKTQASFCRVFVDHCVARVMDGGLDPATAAMAKYWVSELQGKVVDECLQLHGGYGYMNEYPIAQMYRDARVQRIYGGANEIMKLVIARTL